MLTTIIASLCGAGWIATLVTFLVTRHDNKKAEKEGLKKEFAEIRKEFCEIKKELKKNEKDNVRSQLLFLMANYTPEDEHELLTCAEHYFSSEHLHANWYMTPKFYRFIEQQGIAKPSWFEE